MQCKWAAGRRCPEEHRREPCDITAVTAPLQPH